MIACAVLESASTTRLATGMRPASFFWRCNVCTHRQHRASSSFCPPPSADVHAIDAHCSDDCAAGIDAAGSTPRSPRSLRQQLRQPDIIHDICAMLAAATINLADKFHNSVHNAASGYYSIAVASHSAGTSFAPLDGTATAALLETACRRMHRLAGAEVCDDLPYPCPLSEARPTVDACRLRWC